MKKMFVLITWLLTSLYPVLAQVSTANLLCENKINPLGIDVLEPRFTWQLISEKHNVMQTVYEVRVGENLSSLTQNKNILWSSGKINSDQSVYVPYTGAALQSAKKYYWQVRVWDNLKNTSSWSKPAYWQMGLLKTSDWQAKWIEAGYREDSIMRPSPYFRKQFRVDKNIKSATAFITSHGLYEAFINGQRVGDAYLTPGWTSYNKRLQYQVYDITALLKTNDNVVGAMLGSGWYRGYLAWDNNKNIYGNKLALLLQINITYNDGTNEIIGTNETWKSSTGNIQSSEIYNGEVNDARLEKAGWTKSSYDDKDWDAVIVKDYQNNILIATSNEPVKKHETFKPVKILTTPKGEMVADFGQNLVGFAELHVKGNPGDTIVLYHAEVLDKNGNFYTDNLRAAKQQDVYILKGNGEEIFHPHFTFQGFRYVKIEGLKVTLKEDDITAVALYSDMDPTGNFISSNPLLNQLQHNIQWGQKGNFLDVPTDCPQRDERLGWTGDAQVFSRTASFNMNVNNFFAKWLKDVSADQTSEGSVPFVVPNVLSPNAGGAAGWADVATIIPWNMYLAYGNLNTLKDQYPGMKAWVDYMQKTSVNDLWSKGNVFGDWLFYRPFDDNDGRAAITDKSLISQSFFAHSTQLLIDAANVLGKADDIITYTALLKKTKDAFLKEFLTPNGRLVSGTQTAYVLALNFDMLPEELRPQAAQRLVDNIKSYGDHLTTGFLGTPYLCQVLTRFGYTDIAYKLLMQDTYPSWLYPVKMGATTIWERWDGEKPDSTFQTPGMNSFNHYAYGAIGDWMYRTVAGIDELEPGYKKIQIMPHPGGELTSAGADLKTYYGTIRSYWKKENDAMLFDIDIPNNTSAIINIPAVSERAISEGGNTISAQKNYSIISSKDGYVSFGVGSGSYHFIVK